MMESDSHSSDSDEGVELTKDREDNYTYDIPYEEENESTVLEAKIVYLLLPKNVPVSRTTRLQWLLDHLNTIITVPVLQKWNNTSNVIEVVAAITREQSPAKCYRYLVNFRTEVIFLAHSYRFVYCLDMSPSQAIVDIQRGEILFDEILNSFKASVEGLTKQFTISGNSLLFQPNLYLTVMVNTPFYMSPAQQVLVKGVQISSQNLQDVISYVENQFHLLEGKIADVTSMVHEENNIQRNEKGTGLFDFPENDKNHCKVPMVSPDANFVNMLRYSMLAVSLLPENSLSHILVVTDGVVAMPDSNIMESLLFQLHYDSIAVSFIKVGSTFHPHSSAGYISYTDLLEFISHSTMGTCLESYPEVKNESSLTMNIYHELFLLWSFHSNVKCDQKFFDSMKWSSLNDSFPSRKTPILLSKRQTEETTTASILLLLARRMREGFTVDNITNVNGNLEVQLSLQWKSLIYIIYKVSSQWPAIKNNTHLELYISAPYEFLHDITCMMKKEPKSHFRQAIIGRFWMRLSQLSSSDLKFAQQLSVFQNSTVWFTLPESVRSGIPVFNLNPSSPDSNKLMLSPSSTTCPKFINVWQNLCQMETSSWRKWFHTHKVSLVLKHDNPLPKHLHLPNSSQRYQVVQCRQAATALYGKLADWASFVLIDNHTYLKLLYKEQNKPPLWFCIVRISSKLPCAVLNIGFLTNTPGSIRHDTCDDLKKELVALSYMPSPGKTKENSCCTLLQKPLEKILIRYERMPNDFSTVIFPDGTQPPHTTIHVPHPLTGSLFTTLSRYLYHKRWIWSAAHTSNQRLPDDAVSRILTTLTRMRINEGYCFAHSSSGIVTMVLELWMEPEASCVIQYVLFPPHRAWWGEDLCSGSEEDNDLETEYETELQIVTEVWIEPQYGRVQPISNDSRISYMNNKHYYELADVISQIDMQCINSLLTMEHLSIMCQEKNRSFSVDTSISFNRQNSTKIRNIIRRNSTLMDPPSNLEKNLQYPIITPRIEHIPFKFEPINILPLCQQTELLFSMFSERKDGYLQGYESDKSNKLLLDNIQEHLALLHDHEITLGREDSDRFTRQILQRHKNVYPYHCPIAEIKGNQFNLNELPLSQWRCFIKGISITHVIITFIPSTLCDLKALVHKDNIPNDTSEGEERASSRGSNFSDVPINITNSLTLPIYVYDCPLALLMGAYIYNAEETISNKDVYEDHRFKSTESVQDEFLKLKYDEPNLISENKNDDFEVPEYKNNSRHHSKTLVLVHSKCFTISLFVALHNGLYVHTLDVQSAMDQCEENVSEIDITDYMLTICGHMKHHKEDKIDVQQLRQPTLCHDLSSLHSLVKDKFFNMVNVAFIPIPTNAEFYFCRYFNCSKNDKIYNNNNSDDELSNPPSEKDYSVFNEHFHFQRLESVTSDIISGDISPLFLHLVCTMRYNNGEVSNTSVRVLPTCLGELVENIEVSQLIEKKKLQVSLDIMCLTLPTEVQNVITEYSSQGLRTTSFCSDGFQTSIASTASEASFNAEFPEPLMCLPENQRKSIIILREEIKWLLKDEIATALLDIDTVTLNTLNYVMKHVTESKGHSSCIMDVINLNFVFGSNESHGIFVEEFVRITVPNYKLFQEDELYYLVKDESSEPSSTTYISNTSNLVGNYNNEISRNITKYQDQIIDLDVFSGDADEVASQPSDLSSVTESAVGTDGGYDEDVSNDDEDYDWLLHLNNKRKNLPNFWLITKIEQEAVTIYFHCRFLELGTIHVDAYSQVQRAISDEIRELCKKVNQSLLLQSLYETRSCDPLLEPDDSVKDWHSVCSSPISRNSSYMRLRSMDETSDECELMTKSITLSEASLNFKPGYFHCPVVWQTHFILHPRLKTGPGKSGLSRGILALKNILDKFSVSNRNNMFVYRDNKSNVFYLRLHENVQNACNKSAQVRSNEYESAIVSRSPSIASLPLGQNKCHLNQCEQSTTSILSDDIRPRVRSFGEKESKDGPNEDTLILKVHGITEAGTDVQCDLVQVLQNRLDDAVLEFLSVMLARNSMCPLTPEDVHFIQKPFRLAEVTIRLTMQDFIIKWLDSFIHYLKQNLLQFLNIPKYTDNRSHYHFKDYSESEQTLHRHNDDNIFIYNQSQNPSSGSRGIACIALAVIYNSVNTKTDSDSTSFDDIFVNKSFESMVASRILDPVKDDLPPVFLEYRLWKQGRVNIDNLSIKLREAISQATWDVVMEYKILKAPLCEEIVNKSIPEMVPIDINESNLNLNKEIEFNCVIETANKENIKTSGRRKLETSFLHRRRQRRVNSSASKTSRSITIENYEREKEIYTAKLSNPKPLIKLNSFEIGDDGILSKVYAKHLPDWLEFGSALMAPSVKKQKITFTNNHLPCTAIKELLNGNFIMDTPKAFRAIPLHPICGELEEFFVPYDSKDFVEKSVVIARNFDNWKASTSFNGTLNYPDFMTPHALKHTQKFVPTTVNNKFIPRQKILWILVENDSLVIYSYNWARDNIEKLITNCSKLGQWLSVRSCFLNSVISQKLGVFHNQAIVQKNFSTSNNLYTYVIESTSSMIEFPKDENPKKLTTNLSMILEAFRDSYHTLQYNVSDPVGVFTIEMQEMRHAEKKSREEMKKLHSMYQSRTSTTTVSQISLLMQNSRIIHYCHTPLLFLPKWRLKSAATRDHSLCSQAHRTNKAGLNGESWHTELCYGFFCEYRRYLQTLGFMPLQIESSDKQIGIWARDNSSYNNVFYIQKTIMGGILLFTVEFNEPFFTTVLHAIECNRLQTITSRASINRFTLCFLDECDRVKILMHLHSFTYDYHLRCLHNYISNTSGVSKVCDRYSATQFFDDFMKYYNKAPNFARNLIHADTITIKNLVTEGKQLYDYLLRNVGQYDFKVLDMDRGDGELEYILVQVTSTPQVSYKDFHDRQHTDDFEITLVVYNLCMPFSPTDNILHLKYYLILTSKSEIYPKLEVEQKLGKFRTVSSTARSLSALEKMSNELDASLTKAEHQPEYDMSSSDEHIMFSSENQSIETKSERSLSNQQLNFLHIEISQESVNYLGYYSSHEQLMQQMILDKALTTQKNIKEMVAKGMVHCRTHLLWNKLVSPQDSNSLTYDEFMELKSLAKLEHLCDVHPNLGPLLNQPLSWYQGLAKLLLVKYSDQNRTFTSNDGNIQHYVILHPRYFGAFMLLSMDSHTSRGDLYAVDREPHTTEDPGLCLAYRKALLDGFVNCICFYLWYGMI